MHELKLKNKNGSPAIFLSGCIAGEVNCFCHLLELLKMKKPPGN